MRRVLWVDRLDATSGTLYSASISSADFDSIVLLLDVSVCPLGNSITMSAEHSLDPSNPAGWGAFGASPGLSAPGVAAGVAGGVLGGSSEAIGPYVRIRVDVVVATQGVAWGASIVLR